MKFATDVVPSSTIEVGNETTRRSRFFREIGDQSFALISQIILNGSYFLIMLVASMRFEPSEFLKLTFANSLIPLIAAGLDFGLSQSCLALSFENKRQDYVVFNLYIKAVIVVIAFLSLGAGLALSWSVQELILVVAAASMSFWTATRVVEQYAGRFRRYAFLNIALATTRIVIGLAAITYNGWVGLVIAVYILAQLPIQILTLSRSAHARLKSVDFKALRAIVRMAPLTFLSLSFFSSLPLITLWLLNTKGDTLSAAAFGVVLMFLGPVDILFATLKVYIFPKIINSDFKSVDVFGLGHRSIYLLMGGVGVMLALSIVPASFVINIMYDARFPEADLFFVTYFICHALSCVIGLYTLHSQRPGLVPLSLSANAFRAAATILLVAIPVISPYQIVLWSGVIIVLGEFMLTALLLRSARTTH